MKPWTPKLLNAVALALRGGCDLDELADLTGRSRAELDRAVALLADHQPAAALVKLNAPAAAPEPPAPAPAPRRPACAPASRTVLVSPPPFLAASRPIRTAPRSNTSRSIAPEPPPKDRPLKPVTTRVAGWAWWFRAADWAMDEVAALFDRDPEALAQAVEALG